MMCTCVEESQGSRRIAKTPTTSSLNLRPRTTIIIVMMNKEMDVARLDHADRPVIILDFMMSADGF